MSTDFLIGSGSKRIKARVFPEAADIGMYLAPLILEGLSKARSEGKSYLLGCPAGRTGQSTYDALAKHAADVSADLSGMVIVMMDNYVTENASGYVDCPDNAHYSCRGFAFRDIRERINKGLLAEHMLPEANVWTPDPNDPGAYDARIRAMGGIDLFLLASGASDGHVAFNPPGTHIDSPSRIVKIAEATRQDNLTTFPEFGSLEDVPTHGVTVGLATIVQAKAAVLVLHGKGKRAAALRLHECRGFEPDWPVTCIFECHNPEVLLDDAAFDGIKVT